MRLESTKVTMIFLPLSVLGYAWVCQERVHVAAVCVMLFLAGFFSMYVLILQRVFYSELMIDGPTRARWRISLMRTLVVHP